MTAVAVQCWPCAEAEHPLEHRACTGEGCECRCRSDQPAARPVVVEDYDDHQPVVYGEGLPRCEACGYLWPCPAVRLVPPELTDDEKVVMEMVDVGWRVWERVPDGPDVNHTGRGGTVIGYVDDEESRRTYRVLRIRHDRPEIIELAARNLAPPGEGDLPTVGNLRLLWRHLAACVGRQTGTADASEVDHLELAVTLTHMAGMRRSA